MRKLSASALSCFLKSPRQFYWRYVAQVEPILDSVATFGHDRIFGTIWAAYVDRFYKGVPEDQNTAKLLGAWRDQTDGWVPDKKYDAYRLAMETLAPQYYQRFSPEDGVRTPRGSELKLENERFVGILDGLSPENIIHEVKTTSRSPQLSEQFWKVGNSLQVRLYCVMAKADGYCIEFGFKDSPYAIFRGPIVDVTAEQRQRWEEELNTLADSIYALGDDPNHYPCHPDGCCITTRGYVSMCSYQALCEQGLNETTKIFYKAKEHRA